MLYENNCIISHCNIKMHQVFHFNNSVFKRWMACTILFTRTQYVTWHILVTITKYWLFALLLLENLLSNTQWCRSWKGISSAFAGLLIGSGLKGQYAIVRNYLQTYITIPFKGNNNNNLARNITESESSYCIRINIKTQLIKY